MTILHNEITINAPAEKVWKALSNLELVAELDPAMQKATATSEQKSGLGATRKCEMADGKNWFKEKVAEWKENEKLSFELVECSFPVGKLYYTYTLHNDGTKTRITQTMQYQMKMGLLGQLMDVLMVRKKYDKGIKDFFSGLKLYVEKN